MVPGDWPRGAQVTPSVGRARRGGWLPRAAVGATVVWALGNGAILGASRWLAARRQPAWPDVPGTARAERVDEHLWRSAAPSADGYRALAAAGVRTVVDLRDTRDPGLRRRPGAQDGLAGLGVRLVRIPVRDGRVPSPAQVGQFHALVRETDGIVLVHCGAGVGRTGSMVAAYQVSTGRLTPGAALRQALAVGPPSLEQIVFMARLRGGTVTRNGAAVVGASLLLDGPRRLFSHLRRRPGARPAGDAPASAP